MNVLKLLGDNEKEIAIKAAKILKQGGIIIYPAETSYAVGADAMNKEAVSKVHKLKHEKEDKQIGVIVSDLEQIKKIAETNWEVTILAKEFFPGPLNIVVPLKEKVPENLARGTIAFRVPRNRFARALCKELGGPVTATSANTHGETPIFDAEEATQKFFEKVDLIIDSGGLPERPASTIYSIIEHKVLREGEIKKETIKAALW